MMIHRHLFGLWAVLLLAPSAWTQEAGEEIIAKFKQSILDRRQAIRNAKVEVEYVVTHVTDSKEEQASSNDPIKQLISKKPIMTGSITLMFDRDQARMRIISDADTIIEVTPGKYETKRIYSESGYAAGYPVLYKPREKNVAFKDHETDGEIVSMEVQGVVLAHVKGLEPVMAVLGLVPFPGSITKPRDRYINVDEVLNPQIDQMSFRYMGTVTGNTGMFHKIIQRHNSHNIYEYEIYLDQDLQIRKYIESVNYNPHRIYDNIIYDNVKNPVSWRRQNYTSDPHRLEKEYLYKLKQKAVNDSEISANAEVHLKRGDALMYGYPIKKVNLVNGNIVPASEASMLVYGFTASLALFVIVLVAWRIKRRILS